MSAMDLDKARKLLTQEEWMVRSSRSMAGGAALVSIEGTDEDGEDKIEVCRLTLDELDTLRAEFGEKFRKPR